MLQNGKKFRWILPACALVLVLCSLVLLALFLLPRLTSAEAGAETSETSPTEAEEPFRILLAGSDATAGLCDVLMLVSMDRATGRIGILQIPRDTYAAYTQGSYRKLNGALSSLGSMTALSEFLSQALGLRIHRTLHLSPTAFRDIVDAIGGVEIKLEKPMEYEDPAQGLSIHLAEGTHLLDGARAEQFVRYRAGYLRGDLDRMDAQKLFLSALLRKVSTSLTPTAAAKLAVTLLRRVETDLTAGELFALAEDFSGTGVGDVFFVTAPGADATAAESGASYYVLSREGMDELLVAHFGGRKGSFDPKKVFLNEKYASFRVIYESRSGYRLYSAADFG